MSNEPEHIFSLSPQEHTKEIIQLTADQIQKDFSEFSFTIDFTGTGTTPYDELFQLLFPVIEYLISTESSKLYSLLYRIDVSEKEIKNSLNKTPGATLPEIITDQIIRRELKKVLYRKYYR